MVFMQLPSNSISLAAQRNTWHNERKGIYIQIIATGAQRAGKTAQVNANGTVLAFSSYGVTVTGEENSTNNFTSWDAGGWGGGQSFDEALLAFVKASIDFGGDWDAGVNAYDNPPACYPRDDFPNLKLYTSIIDVVDFVFAYMRIRSAKVGAECTGNVTFEVSGMSQGPFILPTG